MNIEKIKNGIVIKDAKDFVLEHIFECGQCFRWEKNVDGSYIAMSNSKVIKLSHKDKDIVIENTTLDDFENIWKDYFDLDKDYTKIKNQIRQIDDNLKKSVEFGNGIRILKQDFHEMIISFIISARNSIPMIQRSIDILSASFGEHIDTIDGKKYYSFPSIQSLANADIEVIKNAKVAFRAPYIISSAKSILEKNIKKCDFENLNLDESVKILQNLSGVGPKVADCIALFGLQKYDAFPVDVHVQRIISRIYLNEQNLSLKKMRDYVLNKFGSIGGYAQQYLFYYERNGKKS